MERRNPRFTDPALGQTLRYLGTPNKRFSDLQFGMASLGGSPLYKPIAEALFFRAIDTLILRGIARETPATAKQRYIYGQKAQSLGFAKKGLFKGFGRC